jgi:dihydrofolate synthase/folylpolyglutamate synthase
VIRESDAILHRLTLLHPRVIDLSLDRIRNLLDRMGRPQDKLKNVIHVAGTNGKGSTIATLRALAQARGLSVNTYTSPHLVHFNERIRLDSGPISEPALVAILSQCEKINDGAPITQFEITTAAAFLAFAQNPATVNLIEVGLGGEFDATNVFDKPDCCIITPIDFDHMDYLGPDLTQIAAAKAGILKRGVPAIIGPQEDEALARIELTAARLGVRLKIHGQDWTARGEHGRFVYEDDNGLMDLDLPRLTGRHQIFNAGAAISAMRQIFPDTDIAMVQAGLAKVEWPGRLQRLTRGPLVDLLPKGAELWLDGAHNGAGARALAEALADMEERASRPLFLIAGIGANKNPADIIKPFAGLARKLIAIPIPDHTSFAPDMLKDIAEKWGIRAASADDPTAAIAHIMSQSGTIAPRVVIFGSLYLAGAILSWNS